MQVLNHVWVVTRGGIIPKMLNPTVTRGAANVASVRRLRNLVHGAIALKSLRALKVCDNWMLSGYLHLPAVMCMYLVHEELITKKLSLKHLEGATAVSVTREQFVHMCRRRRMAAKAGSWSTRCARAMR